MESMNISLPEGLRDFVYEQVATGYGSVSEYIRELIRADQLKKQQDALERQLLEGLASGKGRGLSRADIAALRKTLLERSGSSPAAE
jgi:antitoxin ParD1/3/4